MTDIFALISTGLLAYLIGAIPFGYLIARWKGVNIFQEGSGNIGATNVGRVLGRKFGILIFVLDFAKGALPVGLAKIVAPSLNSELSGDELGVAAGLASLLGHLFSVYLRFRGGKGVATGAGIVFVLLPVPMLVGLVVWVGVVSMFRYVSAASLAAAAALCLARIVLVSNSLAPDNIILTGFSLAVAALVFLRHRSNIHRLLQGNENRLKESPSMQNLLKIVHVLSVGMWFGTLVFFLVVAFTLFGTFRTLAKSPELREEQSWYVQAELYKPKENVTEFDVAQEQGTRIAGYAVSPLFDWYFLIQGICGFLALATAWGWPKQYPGQKVHGRRIIVILLALMTVVAGWPLEHYISDIRLNRSEKTEAYLKAPQDETAKAEAKEARSTFGMWHGISDLINIITIILVAVALGMGAFLPSKSNSEGQQKESSAGQDKELAGDKSPEKPEELPDFVESPSTRKTL